MPRVTDVPVPDVSAVEALAAFGRFAASRGWVPATAGNFSVRLDAAHALVTRSGIDKGTIGPDDVAVVPLDGPIPAGMSAETPLHLERYRADARVGAVVHVHTLPATVLSRLERERGSIRFADFEMQKALAGITTHETPVDLPIFANDQDTVALARRVHDRLGRTDVPGYLLAGHGIYAWGATMNDARRHLEGLEFLLAATLEERRLVR
jgi:methylthioribulose-1-phosphate dehydratase